MTKIPKLFELMKERNVTAKKLSDDTGISSGNISDWKSGRSKPSTEKLSKIAEYFGVTTDYLLGKEDDNIQVYDVVNDNIVVIDDETRDIIDCLRTRPEMKVLFSVTKKATKEDIEKAVRIVEALRDDSEVT